MVDSLAGVALRRKDIDGAQWLTQTGRKSVVECKSISQPDWTDNKDQSKDESLV